MCCESIKGTISGPAGELEIWLECPKQTPKGVLLIAHPHPLHGGTMSNKVVHTLARAALNRGWIALRFNFRGVGKSGGVHDEGHGEQQDLLAVAEWGQSEWPELPLQLAGFSLGARIALLTAAQLKIAQLILVAPPFRLYSDLWSVDCVEVPWAVLMGDADEVVSFEDVAQWVEQQQCPPHFEVFPQASHFFHGRLVDLRRSVEQILG